tara:strand:- start:22 stop:294 length:273 start_codon:yes stop_codon:yes gene_type:complete
MRILVTGASGLVGNAIREESKSTKYEWIFLNSSMCDLRNYENTKLYFEEKSPDYVVHLAANVGGLFKNLEIMLRCMKINFNVLRSVMKIV